MTQIRITRRQIINALKAGGRIDAGGMVVRGEGRVEFSNRAVGTHRPPFLKSAGEFDPEEIARQGRKTGGLTVEAELERWPVREYEKLSLAARVRLALDTDRAADAGLRDKAERLELKLDAFPIVYAQDILEAMAHVADELGPDQGRQGMQPTADQLAMRGGLQIIGCEIRNQPGRFDGVRLVNARLPISIRFIGCVFKCPLLLAHCHLVSLDLSGSAMDVLDATGLQASGNVYLRRTVVRAPVSFSGAHIAGSFDASDVVLAPFTGVAAQLPHDPENGMLNLSKATVENEVRMLRARIWGGLSLRGASIGRSLFLSHAVLFSPLSLFGKWVGDQLETDPSQGAPDPAKLLVEWSRADEYKASQLHGERKDGSELREEERRQADILEEFEILKGSTWKDIADELVHLNPRPLFSALRADGLRVQGSIFARAMLCNGLLRMKYVEVGGSIRLEGSELICAERLTHEIDATLQAVADGRLRFRDAGPPSQAQWERLKGVVEKGRAEGWDVALKLGDGRVQGAVSIGSGKLLEEDQAVTRRQKRMPVDLYGAAMLEGLQVGGALSFRRARFHLLSSPENGSENPPPADESGMSPVYPSKDRSWPILYRAAPWLFAREQARNDETRARTAEKRRKALKKALEDSRNQTGSLRLSQVEVGRDIDLRGCSGLNGVSLNNAVVAGDVCFADKSSGRAEPEPIREGFIRCTNRALDVRGAVNLVGAEIGGDVLLVFNAEIGPIIKAEMAEIGGRLDIYPQVGTRTYQIPRSPHEPTAGTDEVGDQDQAKKQAKGAPRADEGFWLDNCDHRRLEPQVEWGTSRSVCRECAAVVDMVDDHTSWFIDLRNTRATMFTHPPAAWPDPGALSLDGFSYSRSSALGPLTPLDPQTHVRDVHYERSRLRYVWRRRPMRKWAGVVMGAAALIGLVLAACLSVTSGAGSLRTWSGLSVLEYPAFYFIAIVAGTPLILLAIAAWRLAPNNNFQARAIEYLGRLRHSENRVKWRPSTYHALDAYSVAANALRESGRYISANQVEKMRLRRRTEMLSWRHHGPVKLMLNMVDLFAGYGFNLSRAFIISLVVLLVVAGGARYAAGAGHLALRIEEDVRHVSSQGVVEIPANSCVSINGTGGAGQNDCPGVIYALDLLLPFVDLKQAERWKPVRPDRPPSQDSFMTPRAKATRNFLEAFLYGWPSLVSVLGLLLTGVIGVAGASRIESAFARVRE